MDVLLNGSIQVSETILAKTLETLLFGIDSSLVVLPDLDSVWCGEM
jgi:hypothetical protein